MVDRIGEYLSQALGLQNLVRAYLKKFLSFKKHTFLKYLLLRFKSIFKPSLLSLLFTIFSNAYTHVVQICTQGYTRSVR